VRVIWGGDQTVTDIRNHALKPKAFDIVFADRYSICVIDSDAWLTCGDKHRHARGFYNDTYVANQNACSSPRFVLWLGGRIEEARVDFWQSVESVVRAEYPLQGSQSVRKLEYVHRLMAKVPEVRLCSTSNYVVRIWAPEIKPELVEYFPGGGFFVESSAEDISALAPLLGQRCQTLSYFGLEAKALCEFLSKMGPLGIDRLVPIGRALDFSLTWDGYDLIRALSRKIEIA
jgi:hypothetical protein